MKTVRRIVTTCLPVNEPASGILVTVEEHLLIEGIVNIVLPVAQSGVDIAAFRE